MIKDRIFQTLVYLLTAVTGVILATLVVFLYREAHPFFSEHGILEFLFGTDWNASELRQSFQILPMILASVYISVLACLFSFPVSLGVSLYLSFYAKEGVRKALTWVIGMLAGVPSIIYGFFALFVIVKNIEKYLRLSAGESVLAGALVLSLMVLPFFVNTFVASIDLVKKKYLRDSEALGVSKEYFIRNIAWRECRFSILTGTILAVSRAIGETAAVMMVIGNAPLLPRLLSKAQTIPSLIALEMGMSEVGSTHYSALFAAGFVLLVLVLGMNLAFFALRSHRREH